MGNAWMIVTDDMSATSVAGLAVRSGCPVDAIVFGDYMRAESVAALGVASVTHVDLQDKPAEAFAASLADRAKVEQPIAVICSDDASARVLAGAVAVALSAAVTSSVIAVRVEGGRKVVEQLACQGEIVRLLQTDEPVVCVVADGVQEAELGEPVTIQAGQLEPASSLAVVSTNEATGDANGLLQAEKVIGVGLGIGEKENLNLVHELAIAIGAEVACTLPLCDNYHWFPHERVVGTSTQKISPRLYLSFGSSGAPQHMMGVRGSKLIVAVNNDPEAPIFRECAYGIVGDAKAVLPELIEAVKTA